MEEVVNHNCWGLCSEQYCDSPETHFIQAQINGMVFLIGFCKKHADMFEEKIIGGMFK